jgi:hypothetical protein
MSIDSIPVFEARVRDLDLGDHLEAFRALGWTTIANLAYATDHVPGVGESESFYRDIIIPGLKDREHPDRFKLRRLFLESWTLAAHQMRRDLDRADDDKPKALHTLEREKRLKAVSGRLKGLKIEGELEPSHKLVDLCFEMYDSGFLKYVSWEQCTKRDSELSASAKQESKTWKVDASGFMREATIPDPSKADLGSDYRLLLALRRRAIAFEMVDIAAYETLELLTDVLLKEYMKVPLPGHSKVSLEQIHRADREVFLRLSDMCRDGVKRLPDGRRPFDVHIPMIIESFTFRLLLAPLMVGDPSKSSSPQTHEDGSKRALEQAVRDLRAENKRLRMQAPRANASSSNAHNQSKGGGAAKGAGRGGKGQGKGAGNPSRGPRMPPSLVGKSFQTAHGEPICFAFNLPSGCSQAKPGSRCQKGLHICAEPGCSGHHSLTNHTFALTDSSALAS